MPTTCVDIRCVSTKTTRQSLRHSLGTSIYPQRAQPGRHLFKTDRPRRVDVVALCSAHAHPTSAINVPQEYLDRCLRLSTVKSDISLRLQTLRSRGIGRGWTLARLEQRSRLGEPTVGVVARRSLQAPRGAPGSCAHRTSMVVANVVAIAARSRSIPRRPAAVKVQCLASTQRKNGALPQHGRPAASILLSSWQQTMTRRALRDCTLGPLQRHAERLLWAGRRESTKVSYSGKWMRFVNFCTLTLPSEYGIRSSLASKTGCVCHFTVHPPPCMHLHCLYRTRMSNSSYRIRPKGTAWAPMPRCGLKAPTFSAERAFIRKRAESSEWYTITVI